MGYATAREIPPDTIPVIDIGALQSDGDAPYAAIGKELSAASQAIGFFYVRNHGISAALIERAFAVSRAFFECAPELKATVAVTPKKRGYIVPRTAIMKDARTRDYRETFLWGREYDAATLAELDPVPLIGANRWPAFVPDLEPVLTEYFEACVALGRELLRALAIADGLPAEHFAGRFERTMSRGSTLYYPPQDRTEGEEQFGFGPHTDWGVITLLAQDAVGGLQVRARDGSWINAHPIPGTYVVNIGDCLERWTNKRLLSNSHRVVNSAGRVRQSIAVFVDPDFDTPVVPNVKSGEVGQYAPTTCGEQVLESFRRAYGG